MNPSREELKAFIMATLVDSAEKTAAFEHALWPSWICSTRNMGSRRNTSTWRL